MDHLRKFQVTERSQHRFMRNISCLTNLLEYLKFVSSYIDRGILVDVIYLDFQKAFDKVLHTRLLAKGPRVELNGDQWDGVWVDQILVGRQRAEGCIKR